MKENNAITVKIGEDILRMCIQFAWLSHTVKLQKQMGFYGGKDNTNEKHRKNIFIV